MIITNCDSTDPHRDSDKHWPFLLEVATTIPTHSRPQCFNFLSCMRKIRHAIGDRFASSWFVKSAWVSLESNLQKLLSNNSPRAFVLFFCFAPSGFKYFSRKISTDRLFQESIFIPSAIVSPVCFAGSTFNFKRQFFPTYNLQ